MSPEARQLVGSSIDYEFTDEQSRLVVGLARWMRLVGLASFLLGAALITLGVYVSWLQIERVGARITLYGLFDGGWMAGLPGVLFLSISTLTLRASRDSTASPARAATTCRF